MYRGDSGPIACDDGDDDRSRLCVYKGSEGVDDERQREDRTIEWRDMLLMILQEIKCK
jgi:hypothetical protein